MSRLLIIALITLIMVYLGQLLYFKVNAAFSTWQNQSTNQKDLAKTSDDYQKLIAAQAQRQKSSPTPTSSAPLTPKLQGSYQILFVLTKPAYMSDSQITPLMTAMEGEASTFSLNYIPTFYKEQAQKFAVHDLDVKVSFTKIYPIANLAKIGDVNQFWDKDVFGPTKLEDTFHSVLTDNHLSVDKNTMVVYLFFDDSYSATSYDARFFEHKAFRSFANPDTSQAMIDVYSLDPAFSSTLTEIAAHEVLHLFGATDKYEEPITDGKICSDRGRGDPDLQPVTPQVSSDIMCGFIELSFTNFKKGTLVDHTLDINKITAQEIGWN